MNNKKMSISKPIVSITEMVQMIQLSRARFYQLVSSGFFPKPLIDEKTKRPYYDAALQEKMLECRQSGIGANGSFMLFYSPRKNGTTTSSQKKQKVDPMVKELTETLESMGLETTPELVKNALTEIYPDGTKTVEQGVVIRELFRFLKQKMSESK